MTVSTAYDLHNGTDAIEELGLKTVPSSLLRNAYYYLIDVIDMLDPKVHFLKFVSQKYV